MSRLYIVCFDVTDPRRLRKVADTLENFGMRVQKSVFECYLDNRDRNRLLKQLTQLIDAETDHVRCYPLCNKDQRGILIDGIGRLTRDDPFHLY